MLINSVPAPANAAGISSLLVDSPLTATARIITRLHTCVLRRAFYLFRLTPSTFIKKLTS